MTLAVAGAIIAESTLTFLGIGLQAPNTSWGRLLNEFEQMQGMMKKMKGGGLMKLMKRMGGGKGGKGGMPKLPF